MPTPGKTIFECRLCGASTGGSTDGEFFTEGWGRILHIDGPDAICPSCCEEPFPTAEQRLLDEYPNACIAKATPSYISEEEFDRRHQKTEDSVGHSRLKRAALRKSITTVPAPVKRTTPIRPEPPAPDAPRTYITVTHVDTTVNSHGCSVTLPLGATKDQKNALCLHVAEAAFDDEIVWLETGVRGDPSTWSSPASVTGAVKR